MPVSHNAERAGLSAELTALRMKHAGSHAELCMTVAPQHAVHYICKAVRKLSLKYSADWNPCTGPQLQLHQAGGG